MRLYFCDYRYALSVLEHQDFRNAKNELLAILRRAPVPLLNPLELDARRGGVKRRKRAPRRGDRGDRYFFLPVDQKRLNSHLDDEFRQAGWELQPPIVPSGRTVGPTTGLKGDYKKGRLQVEVQFGNMARWYTDVFKFQLSYSLDEIDVAVLVVPMQHFANLIDENIAHFERIARELPWAKMSLTLPILVVGIEPETYDHVRDCYNLAAETFLKDRARNGETVVPIPFEERIAEEPQEED